MKIPRFESFSKLPEEHTALPAVSVVLARGFLSVSLPLVKIGRSKDPVLFAFVERQDRVAIIPKVDKLWLGFDTSEHPFVVVRPSGSIGSWNNGEALWVSVPWVLGVPNEYKQTTTIGAELTWRALHQAARVANIKPSSGTLHAIEPRSCVTPENIKPWSDEP